jgi:hypothetical protein
MPLTARVFRAPASIAFLGVAALGGISLENQAMSTTVEVTGDGPTIGIDEAEGNRMAAALQAALSDDDMLARSKAPAPLLDLLKRDYPATPISIGDQFRAGQWLLVSARSGPRWDLRMVSPQGPRRGLLFQVPLVQARDGRWSASRIDFVKAW